MEKKNPSKSSSIKRDRMRNSRRGIKNTRQSPASRRKVQTVSPSFGSPQTNDAVWLSGLPTFDDASPASMNTVADEFKFCLGPLKKIFRTYTHLHAASTRMQRVDFSVQQRQNAMLSKAEWMMLLRDMKCLKNDLASNKKNALAGIRHTAGDKNSPTSFKTRSFVPFLPVQVAAAIFSRIIKNKSENVISFREFLCCLSAICQWSRDYAAEAAPAISEGDDENSILFILKQMNPAYLMDIWRGACLYRYYWSGGSKGDLHKVGCIEPCVWGLDNGEYRKELTQTESPVTKRVAKIKQESRLLKDSRLLKVRAKSNTERVQQMKKQEKVVAFGHVSVKFREEKRKKNKQEVSPTREMSERLYPGNAIKDNTLHKALKEHAPRLKREPKSDVNEVQAGEEHEHGEMAEAEVQSEVSPAKGGYEREKLTAIPAEVILAKTLEG